MNNYREKVYTGFFIFFIAVISIILFMALILIADLFFDKYRISNWDPLAAIGAIIGGSLTLVGVAISMNREKRRRFMSEAPLKIRKLDHLILEMGKTFEFLESNLCWDLAKKVRYIIDESVNIDGILYSEIYNYESKTKFYVEMYIRSDTGTEIFERFKKDFEKDLISCMKSIINFRSKYLKQYTQITASHDLNYY